MSTAATETDIDFAEALTKANNQLALVTRRIDKLLGQIATHIAESKDPMNVSKRAARAELDDLAELDLQLRRLKDLSKPPHTDAHNLQGDVEERMSNLTIPAERPTVTVPGYVLSPVPKRSAGTQDGFEWTSPELHEALSVYGYDALIKTQPNSQSVLGAINELKKEYGEHERLPDKFVPELDEDGDPVIDKATGEIKGRTINLEDYVRINERPSMRVTKGKK